MPLIAAEKAIGWRMASRRRANKNITSEGYTAVAFPGRHAVAVNVLNGREVMSLWHRSI